MSIPLVPNPIPAFQGPSGGDIANGFLNAFFATRNSMRADDANQRANMDQALKMDEANYQRGLRPLREESMRLGVDQQRQTLQFGAQDQQRQNDQFDYEKNVLRPLQEAQQRNSLVSAAYGIEAQKQQLDANSAIMGAQLSASQAIEQSMVGLAGFGQSMRSAPTEVPVSGKVTSYGYAGDPHSDSNSANRIGAYDNTLDNESLAVSPDVERQMKAQGIKMGDRVHLRLADGSVVTRRLADRTMQDADAIAKFGKPLTGRFDFFSPDGVHALDGRNVVSFSKSTQPAVAGMEAGPVRPEQITNALNQYDTLVRNMQLLPPNSPSRIRAEVAVMQAQADPTFSSLLKQRDINTKNRELGNAAAVDMLSMPTSAREIFNTQYEGFANVRPVLQPDGTYDMLRVGKAGLQPLLPAEKAAFVQAWDAFSKNYKFGAATNIPAQTATQLGKYYSQAAMADEMLKKYPDMDSAPDDVRKIIIQGYGAKEAIKNLLTINPTAGKLLNPGATAADAIGQEVPVSQQDQSLKDHIMNPQKKTIPATIDGEPEFDAAKQQREKMDTAINNINERVLVKFPDNGKDSFTENPALAAARRIMLGLTREGKQPAGLSRYLAMSQGDVAGMEPPKAEVLAADHVMQEADLKPDEMAAHDVTNKAAIVEWAKRTLENHGYDTNPRRGGAPATSTTSTEAKNKLSNLLDTAAGKK